MVALALGVGVASALLIAPRLAHSARWAKRPAPAIAMRARIDPLVRSAALVTPVEPQTFEQLTPAQAEAANAAVPFSTAPMPPAAPFRLTGASALDRARAQTCLAMAVYYEAGSESADGEAAVAQVVLNRVRNPLFPATVCGVVFQGSTLPTGCQFTFTCDGSLRRTPSLAGWRRASAVAERALNGYVAKDVGEATHYHTVWVVPYWQSSVVKLTRIGAHIFYRWSGALGTPAAFTRRYTGDEPPPPALAGLVAADVAANQTIAPIQCAAAAVKPPKAPVVKPQVQIAKADAEPMVALPSGVDPQQSTSYFAGHVQRDGAHVAW